MRRMTGWNLSPNSMLQFPLNLGIRVEIGSYVPWLCAWGRLRATKLDAVAGL